jgi:acetyl esterase
MLNGIQEKVTTIAARFLFSLPDGLLTLIFGKPPEVAAELRADAWAISKVTDIIERNADVGIGSKRDETEMFARAVSAPVTPVVDTGDFDLGSGGTILPARLYTPPGAPDAGPLLVYFHGGGWVVGSIESHDRSCRHMADGSGARVLAVEYRLAPEDPFPAAADDARQAWRSVTADPARFGTADGLIAVGGDSAGGNLAAVLCQDLLAEGESQPRFQALIYPVTQIGSTFQSKRDFATGFYLTTERMDWYDERYAPEPPDDCRASPLNSPDLVGLAPAWIISALADPLRDEGEEYARRLAEAGVAVECDRFPLVHAWFNMTASRSSRAAHAVLAEGLARRFAD